MARKNKPYSDKSAPYATMGDGPDSYLYKKGSKQKLVGSADNTVECPQCEGSGIWTMAGNRKTECPQCDGEGYLEELEEDDAEGYSYRDEIDYEEDNSKIWHYGKAPGEDWEVIDRSPYREMDDFAWDLYVGFHKDNGRWPNQDESRKIEDLEYRVMTKTNEELNEIRRLAGLAPLVAEDCDEDDDKNDDGECSPFTHADDNVDMVREDDLDEDIFDEDFLAPPKDVEHGHYEDDGEEDWDVRDAPELDRQTNYDAPSRYDGDDSFDFDIDNDYYMDEEPSDPSKNYHVGRAFASGEIEEQGPGDDEFDYDDDAMVDVGDDEDYETYDFEDEFDAMMGNTMKYESVEEQVVAMNKLRKAAGLAEAELPVEEEVEEEVELDEKEGDKCARCRKGTMERGETFFGPAERCNHCGFQRQLDESAPYESGDDYDFIDFKDDKAYFLVADEIGDRIIFGMNNEVGIPEQYVDAMIGLLRRHGFEKGFDYEFTSRGNPNHIANRKPDVEEDLQNGYNEHEFADAYDDYFPLGSHQTPSDDLGPTASGYGDNAMDNKMRSKKADDVYESMRQKYRRFRLS